MRAAMVERFGSLPILGEVEEPVAACGEALVAVRLGSLNPVDIKIASGSFFGNVPSLPYVPGSEGMGRVLTSERLTPGTRVRFSASRPGALAELVAVLEESLVVVPDGVEDAFAAGIGVAGLAAWGSLRAARLQAGERVLILGATGMVGRLSIQLAKILGASRVVAAARDNARLLNLTTDLAPYGPDEFVTLDGREDEAIATAIKDAAEGQVDVIVDPLWGSPARAAIMAAALRARLVNLGDSVSTSMELTSDLLRSKSLTLIGYTNYALSDEEQSSGIEDLLEYSRTGRLSLNSEVTALDNVSGTWERLAGSPHQKLLVTMNPSSL
ncbi:zinc-binding alcohol dehydrogenase family protein [Ferrimicrobium sp.]|uniref:quinone oxidoreductase family protein n=1 Tax=Ferrimicrobium sp. TaxID=2926050 RepID=UPI0026318043|nr:zinc-binding alcohol dehydrogenase family protein [Ferrimicrobium sp.]